jgi:hypothetical protein
VNAIRRRLLPATARKLYRDAGPPTTWVMAAFLLAGVAAWAVASLPIPAAPILAAAVAIVIVTVPSVLDVDGWRIRFGMAWLAAEQRRRATTSQPRTAAEAERWLATNVDGPPLERASALITAGRAAEARALIETVPTQTPEDRVRRARMRAVLDGLERGVVDPAEALDAIAALPPELRPYHRLALAWSTAWVDSRQGRPWRHAFATASRGFGPRDMAARSLIRVAIDELLATIVVFVGLLMFRIVGWL